MENVNIVKAKPIIIEDNVWITMNAIILPGVTIGKNSVIAAGSIVTKSMPSNSLIGGNPAKVIKEIDRSYPFYDDLEKDIKKRDSLIDVKYPRLRRIIKLPFRLIRLLIIKLI